MAAPTRHFRLKMFRRIFIQKNNFLSVTVHFNSSRYIDTSKQFLSFIHTSQNLHPRYALSLKFSKKNSYNSEHSNPLQIRNNCFKNNSQQTIHCKNNGHTYFRYFNCGPPVTSAIPHKHCRCSSVIGRNYSFSNKQKLKDDPIPNVEDANLGISRQDVKENIWTVPNLLTTMRLVSAPVIGYLVIQENLTWALGLFVCSGLTDMLDGYIARNFKNQMSTLGTVLDPLADKVLMFTLAVTLTVAQLMPVPLAAVIIGRDVLLITASLVVRYISLPKPINTGLQISLISATLASPVFDFVGHPALQLLWWVTAATTVGSGIGYAVFWKRTVKFLNKGK